MSWDENHDNWTEIDSYIREDSQRVYYKSNDEPRLLYDFGLNAGDEIELRSTTYSVDSVKYLSIFNNEKRKHIYLSIISPPDYGFVVWIESIGSNCGFFENRGNIMYGGTNILLCCEENGIYLYKDTTYNTCFFEPQ